MRSYLAIFLASVVFVGAADAQLPGNLRGKAKSAVKKSLGKSGKKKGDKAKDGSESRSRPPACKDRKREYPPGVSYSSLLDGVVMRPDSGQLSLNKVQATFLPEDCKGGFVVLRAADGEELYQISWRPDWLKKPYARLKVHKVTDLRTEEVSPNGQMGPVADGDYVLDFYIPSERFYTFPFSVTKAESDDPFGGGTCYSVGGVWRDIGYLFYREAKPDQTLKWKSWVRNETCNKESVKVRIEVKRGLDSELVCTSRESTTRSLKPQWTCLEFDLVFPKDKDVPRGTHFKARDLLGTDGQYALIMKIGDKVHGIWKFAVKGGKLNYTGRTLRGKTDPLTFIEGGRDAWWYVRERE